MKPVGLLLLVTLIFSSILTRAAEGCLLGNDIYTVPNGTIRVSAVLVVSNYTAPTLTVVTTSCPRASNVNAVQALVTSCSINSNITNLGYLVTYNRLDPPVGCDLDDYTWALSATAAAAGFLFIRRKIC